ncbi:hypothetical protein IPJ72_01715 [Candidatus Peregrinibacteria bacterium]|nr:MAG: hypothetical protein IPJ72_01715 [Candidatus Peregrinibacteria bacterium]
MLLSAKGEPMVFNPSVSMPVFMNEVKVTALNTKEISIYTTLSNTEWNRKTIQKLVEWNKTSPEWSVKLYVINTTNDPIINDAIKSLVCLQNSEWYWSWYQQLIASPPFENKEALLAALKQTGWMEEGMLDECMENPMTQEEVRQQNIKATKQFINRFPSVVVSENKLVGDQPIENILRTIRHSRLPGDTL